METAQIGMSRFGKKMDRFAGILVQFPVSLEVPFPAAAVAMEGCFLCLHMEDPGVKGVMPGKLLKACHENPGIDFLKLSEEKRYRFYCYISSVFQLILYTLQDRLRQRPFMHMDCPLYRINAPAQNIRLSRLPRSSSMYKRPDSESTGKVNCDICAVAALCEKLLTVSAKDIYLYREGVKMIDSKTSWLVGSDGLYQGKIGSSWDRMGSYSFQVTDIMRAHPGIIVATNIGLWMAPKDADLWLQLHDETLTEVQAIARVAGDPGIAACTPYGIALGSRDERGVVRWRSCSDKLGLNERFTNTIVVDPGKTGRWIVGTEAGVLVYEDEGKSRTHTSLNNCPVYTICFARGLFWAGTDGRGVWSSADGLQWKIAGRGMEEEVVFAVVDADGDILAGTMQGLFTGNGKESWKRVGPRIQITALAVHPRERNFWMAGSSPGGLWYSRDGGTSWMQTGVKGNISAIAAPE